MTAEELLAALRDCYDPVLQRNVVDAGLLRDLDLTEDRDAPGASIPGVPPRYIARLQLQANSSDEAAIAQLRAQIENRLAGLPQISRIHITVIPSPFSILR